jgi:hypothetical protein
MKLRSWRVSSMLFGPSTTGSKMPVLTAARVSAKMP